MRLDELKRILEHSSVKTLQDENGWNVAAIGFLSTEDAQTVYNLLWDMKRLLEQFPDMKLI